jgi:hypothetical protein
VSVGDHQPPLLLPLPLELVVLLLDADPVEPLLEALLDALLELLPPELLPPCVAVELRPEELPLLDATEEPPVVEVPALLAELVPAPVLPPSLPPVAEPEQALSERLE